MLTEMLERDGHQVIGDTASGAEVVTMYKQMLPDLVILGLVLTDLSGLETLQEIMAYDLEAKVVICSGGAEPGLMLEAMKSGASDFLLKPVTIDKVRKMLNSVFA
jgi:two-component system chemotaxis response regulator CheY